MSNFDSIDEALNVESNIVGVEKPAPLKKPEEKKQEVKEMIDKKKEELAKEPSKKKKMDSGTVGKSSMVKRYSRLLKVFVVLL